MHESTPDARADQDPERGTIRLGGEEASDQETERARLAISALREVLPRLDDDGDAARVLHDIGELLASPLGDAQGALAAMQEAFRRQPSLATARGYRKAARRAAAQPQLLEALEGEIRLAPTSAHRATLEIERALVLEEDLADARSARAAYRRALDASPMEAAALAGLERLALAEGDRATAAEMAAGLAATATDPQLRADASARAARHLEAAGDLEAALAQAAEANAISPGSPSVDFVLERLLMAQGAKAELAVLRRAQITRGAVQPAEGWFDIAILARYQLGDTVLATRAFAAAAEDDDPASRAVALAELAVLLEKARDWKALLPVQEARIAIAPSAGARASLWHHVARIKSEQLGDEEGAVKAIGAALNEDPAHGPALEWAGRRLQPSDSRDRLAAMHRLEAEAARTTVERAIALRRAGELMTESPETAEEGIALLTAAVAQLPNNLAAFAALQRALTRRQAWPELRTLYETELSRASTPSRRASLLVQLGSLCADRLGDRAGAAAAFLEAASTNASEPPYSLIRLCELLEAAGDDDGLADALERLAARSSEDAEVASVLERLAAVHERRGAVDAALEVYRRAVEVAPPTHPVHIAAGRVYLREGRFVELVALFDTAARTGEAQERARWMRKSAEVLDRHLGRVDDAIAHLRMGLSLAPDDRETRQFLSEILLREERWHPLVLHLAAEPPEPLVVFRRAALAEAAGDHTAAASLYREALKKGVFLARLALERLLAHTGQWAQLAEDLGIRRGAAVAQAHASMRRAEIAAERLGDDAGAIELLDGLVAAEPAALAPRLALLPLLAATRQRQAVVLASLDGATRDPAARAVWLARRAAILEAADDRAALDCWTGLLALQPKHPTAAVALELALESRRERSALVDLHGRNAEDPRGDPGLASCALASRGDLLEELGVLRQAADALEESLVRQPARLTRARLALPRIYQTLGDDARVRASLEELARALPAGPERAACLRVLGRHLHRTGAPAAEVAGVLDQAVQAHPLDYDALRELADALPAEAHATRLVDPLMRAFAAEKDPERLAVVGAHLAVLLLASGRLEPASETVDRLLGALPNDLRTLALRAEIDERLGAFAHAATTLKSIADREDAGRLRFEALRRLATLEATELNRPDEARATAARLATLPVDHPALLSSRLVVEQLVVAPELAAATLAQLAEHDALDSEAHVGFQLRLATLQEEDLDDPTAAIETLGRIGASPHRQAAVTQLLRLGEKTGRWDLASTALERALDSGGPMEPAWELAIRHRLAALLDGPLERPMAAARHLERIAELDPGQSVVHERLAEIVGPTDPQRAIEHHRAILRREPDRVASYRFVRQMFIAAGQDDAAFCAEAMLVGLDAANEEESYFYRQRRAFLSAGFAHELSDADRALLTPGLDDPDLVVLGTLESVLGQVSPVDFAGYGVDPGAKDQAGGLDVAQEIAHLLGAPPFRLYLVSPKLGPAVEPGDPPSLMVPRTLVDATRREQQFVLGALLARITVRAVASDPCRLNALPPRQLQYLLWAACDLTVPGFTAPSAGNVIYEDVKRRLGTHLAPEVRETLAGPCGALAESAARIDPLRVRLVSSTAAARVAMLAAQDPSVAVACYRTYRAMFDEPGARGDAGLFPEAVRAALPFAVSAEHAALRRRLRTEVST